MPIVSFSVKQGVEELRKQKVIVISVVTAKSLFGMCDCTVDSDFGEGDFCLGLGVVDTNMRDCMCVLVWAGVDCESMFKVI